MQVLHLLMYVLYVPTVDARTSIEGKTLPAAVRTYLLLYVRTYCCTYVHAAHAAVPLCTYVPTVRTTSTNEISTHLLLYVQLMIYVFIHCYTYFLYTASTY